MDWWGKVVFPLRRAWEAVAARIEASRKTGTGILKLHDDVRTCGYGDVQVMWEMLRSEMEISHATRRKRICWRALPWSRRSGGWSAINVADRKHPPASPWHEEPK